MKKVILVMFVAFLGVLTMSAQVNFGVKASFNASNITGIEDPGEGVDFTNNYKPGFSLGVTAQYMLTQQAGIETGLYYSLLGCKSEAKVSALGYYYKETQSVNPSYLQLPISFLYKFEIGQDLYLYPSAGIYLGYGIAGKAKVEGATNLSVGELPDGFDLGTLEDDFFGKGNRGEEVTNRFDFGIGLGVNLQYSKFVIGLGYDLGLTKINKESISGEKDAKNVNFKVSLGYFF
jgi:hypothetical protein